VLLASHVLSEVESVSDRMGVLHRGRLVALETADSLRRRGALLVVASFEGATPALDGLEDVDVIERTPDRLVLRAHPPLDALVKRLAQGSVVTLEVHEPSLEDLVQSIAAYGTP
jgi:ABC-2 type transport system ATP-binding protein